MDTVVPRLQEYKKYRMNLINGYRGRTLLVLLTCLCIYSQYHTYTYWGEIITTAPFTHNADQLHLLMQLGNNSVVTKHPIWTKHKRFMTMCTMIKNEAKYVREWVEFHSLVGVDRFVIFDNGSNDSPHKALEGTIADVTIIEWPPAKWPDGNPHEGKCQAYHDGKNLEEWAFSFCQIAALHECLKNENGLSRWILGADVDEFFMPRYDNHRLYTMPEVLEAYNHMHGISLRSFTYGTNHYTTPISANELMIETHILRNDELSCAKEIVDPSKAETYPLVHWAQYHNPMWNYLIAKTIPRQHAMVRFNHYPHRSVQESLHKGFKNMNPGIFDNIDKLNKADIPDPYMIPMVPLIKRRLAGELIWIG